MISLILNLGITLYIHPSSFSRSMRSEKMILDLTVKKSFVVFEKRVSVDW